jgi:hypothetical protein
MKEAGIGTAEKSTVHGLKTLSAGLKKLLSIWAEKANISSSEKKHASTARGGVIGAEK